MPAAKFRSEYRINKKGAECFRTDDLQKAQAKLQELAAKRPGVYTMQTRHVPLDRYGVALRDGCGKPIWSTWQ